MVSSSPELGRSNKCRKCLWVINKAEYWGFGAGETLNPVLEYSFVENQQIDHAFVTEKITKDGKEQMRAIGFAI